MESVQVLSADVAAMASMMDVLDKVLDWMVASDMDASGMMRVRHFRMGVELSLR